MIKVIVRAPVLSQSGYGEHARFVVRALRSQPEKFDITLLILIGDKQVGYGKTMKKESGLMIA